jgi:hypothetical protein
VTDPVIERLKSGQSVLTESQDASMLLHVSHLLAPP